MATIFEEPRVVRPPETDGPSSGPRPDSLVRALLAGLAAGAIAGIVAALVNLPLRSPDEAFFNSASVVLGALLAGLAGGALWHALRTRAAAYRLFLVSVAAAFLLVTAGVLALDALPSAPLSGLPGFLIPLAAIVLAGVALLTPPLARPAWRAPLVAPVVTLAAVAVGAALMGRGDAESGRLALPSAPAAQQTARVLRPADVAGMAFAVAPGDSTVTYTVREKLSELPLPSDAVGRTSQVGGTIFLDGRPSTITIDVSTFQSDQSRRDNFIRTMRGGPQLGQYPQAQLTVESLDLPAEYREGETVTRTVTGTMTLRGVTRPQSFAVEARMQDNVLQVHATTDFTWADYQMPPPNLRGFVQVEDNVHIEALLVAHGDRP